MIAWYGAAMVRRLCAELLVRADCLLTLARLTVLDWLAGPPPETPTDRAIREENASGCARRFQKSISTIRSRDELRTRHLARRKSADPAARCRCRA
jgi:hypothetical protein